MTTYPRPQCEDCRHQIQKEDWGYFCKAYPGGIPTAILTGTHDHRKPYPGDRGILFEPKKGQS